MKRYLILCAGVFALLFAANAQNASDALRYSTSSTLGTARSVAVAGSMSALGGDFAVLGLNPAGLGAYRSSEFMLSPALFGNHTESFLSGSDGPRNTEQMTEFLLSNLGFVFASRPRSAKWKTSNFAIGLNKVGDYHQSFAYSGSTAGSITDRFAELANGLSSDALDAFEAGLAYSTGAIYDFDENNIYETDYELAAGTPLFKTETVNAEGYNTELMMAYAANYDEKLLFGLSVGVPILSYEEDKFYREDDETTEAIPFFNSLRFEEFLSTSGSGFNFKAGAIFKITKWVSLGASYHSGTWYSLTDNFYTAMEYRYTDSEGGHIFDADSPDGTFNYNLKTPSTLTASIGAVLSQSGFLTAEIQYTDYGDAEFDYSGRGNGNAFQTEERMVNDDIREQLGGALKISAGGEMVLQDFRLRGGLTITQSPFAGDDGFDETFSGGIGWRSNRFFIDLGYQLFTEDQGYLPYAVDNAVQPLVENMYRSHRFVLTFGYKWL